LNDKGKVLLINQAVFPIISNPPALSRFPTKFDEFLPTGLDGEISLGEGDFGLFEGVAILGDQVAGIAGEGNFFDAALGAAADFDYFADIGKMVFPFFARTFVSVFGFFNGVQEIVSFGITQNGLQFAGAPAFGSGYAPGVSVSRRFCSGAYRKIFSQTYTFCCFSAFIQAAFSNRSFTIATMKARTSVERFTRSYGSRIMKLCLPLSSIHSSSSWSFSSCVHKKTMPTFFTCGNCAETYCVSILSAISCSTIIVTSTG